MAKRSRRRTSRQPSGLPYLVVGLGLGLTVAAAVYLSDVRVGTPGATARGGAPANVAADRGRATDRAASGAAAAPGRTSAGTAGAVSGPGDAGAADIDAVGASETADQANNEPRFEFYDILPQYEVVVPEVETVTRTTPNANTTIALPAVAPGRYIVQAGSFRSHADADRRQASLALLGIESRIQKVAIDDDEFHRVRIGPISDPDELDRIRAELRGAGVDSLMMKVNE